MPLNIKVWTVLFYLTELAFHEASITEEPNANHRELILGLITPPTGKLGFERVAAATTMAITDAKAHGLLQDVDVRFVWRNGDCNGKTALGVAYDIREEYDVDAFIGLPCSIASINAGKLIAYWNLPHISFSSTDPVLSDKVTYNTLVRLISPFDRLADAMVEMFRYYSWTRATVVTAIDDDGYCDHNGRAIEQVFETNNFTHEWLRTNSKIVTQSYILQWLKRIKQTSRIVVVCGDEAFLHSFMLLAQDEGMTRGDYVYITPGLFPADNMERRWSYGGATNERSRRAFSSLLQMALGYVASPGAVSFMKEIPYQMTLPPWNYNGTLESGQIGSYFTLFVFDSVYLYAMLADDMYKMGTTPRNGSLMLQLAKSASFVGKTGLVRLDDNGDRIGDYRLWHLPHNGAKYEAMMDIFLTKTNEQKIHILSQRFWSNQTGIGAPADTPACGFLDELCPQDTSARDNVILFVVIVSVVIVGLGVGAALWYRRRKFEESLELMLWKVRYEDIHLIHPKHQTDSSMKSMTTDSSSSSVAISYPGTGTSLTHQGIRTGYYKGVLVNVKLLNKTAMLLNRNDHVELKNMREMNHENVNAFIGAAVDPPNICVITKYCSKGSLEDVLYNDDIRLDHNFKVSFVSDIIMGMEYIHRSPFKCHGRLKSSNCLVDGRWVVKVTDWGLSSFHEARDITEEKAFTALLWRAPELLRMEGQHPNGSQKGDTYSFAIILQEILFRQPPFSVGVDTQMIARDIVGRVRNGETPPMRPSIPQCEKSETSLETLMQECWAEDPVCRPDFMAIRNRFTEINRGKKFNIMDNMLGMMEKYANNLEEVISERTRQLVEEKKKTDMLLYRMLPTSVADSLKSGSAIAPELFQNASVYFSDVVEFTKMASTSSPMEVVNFLNDLWTVFDDVIVRYQVYKVETIGDGYMVASGLPAEMGQNHASELANMALDILSSVLTFKIRHRPNQQLRVRIGMHSGPVVAGVVGHTMPRYCLFGDTVNTASRMESSGQPQRIHISEEACKAIKATGSGFFFRERGTVEIKGKGMQKTYWLEGRQNYSRPLPPIPSNSNDGVDAVDD